MMMIVTFLLKGQGLLPEISTAANSIWYYVQVVGENNRSDRVFEVKGNYLYGAPIDKTNDAQLFRFERDRTNYYIISKSTNKRLDIVMNGTDESLGISDTGVTFRLQELNTNYFNIISTKALAADATKIYAQQGNSGAGYKIVLVNTTYNSTVNSQYSFVRYDAVNLEYSTESAEIWYHIASAKPTYESLYVTDMTETNGVKWNFSVKEKTDNNPAQEWKLVRKADEKVEFVNRSTGNIIQTKSEIEDFYYSVLFTKNISESAGWNMEYLNGGQYVISGEEDAGTIRYWHFTEEGKVPDEFVAGNGVFSSGFAWRLKKSSNNHPSANNVINNDNIVVYACDGKIIVTGTDVFQIRTIQGISVNKNDYLPVGVYLVTVKNETIKVVVR